MPSIVHLTRLSSPDLGPAPAGPFSYVLMPMRHLLMPMRHFLFYKCSCQCLCRTVSSPRLGELMVQRVSTVAFEGIEARSVDVQVQVAPGLPAFNVVGLPDKAVSEARERVRAALTASGLALPARRITVNLAPADLPKEGSSQRLDGDDKYKLS